MTSQSPRIYLYKITFEEVPYYYYGVHKEKRYNEYYMGTPITHEWCWDFYSPKKQTLELFPYTDEGYIEAQKVEKRLIGPVYNTDKWCLNESCGGKVSLEICRKNGKKQAQKNKKNKTCIFGMSKEQLSNAGKLGGKKTYEEKIGAFAIEKDVRQKISKKCGNKIKELGIGVCGLSFEDLSKAGKKGIETNKKNKTGLYGITTEQRKKNSKKIMSQKWQCTETGFTSTISGLTRYQKNRNIDTSKRKKII
jgi:hypothetical protein